MAAAEFINLDRVDPAGPGAAEAVNQLGKQTLAVAVVDLI